MIEKKYLVDSYFRVSKSFIENNTNSKFLNKIKNKLNSINFIYEDNIKIRKINFFYSHLSEIHYFNKSIEVINQILILTVYFVRSWMNNYINKKLFINSW